MSEEFPTGFDRKTLSLLRDHDYFFSEIQKLIENEPLPLRLLGVDPEAHTEFRTRKDKNVEVDWIYPLDDNDRPDDGRVYLKDTFIFDASEQILKDFKREAYVHPNSSSLWRSFSDTLNAAFKTPKDPEDVKRFALEVARTYGRPLSNSLLNRGISFLNQGKIHQAHQDFTAAIAQDGSNARAYYYRALPPTAYSYAVKDLQKAIELDPKLSEAYLLRGRLYFYEGQEMKAFMDFTKAIETNPEKSALAFYYRALLKSEIGRYLDAKDDLLKYLRRIPDAKGYFQMGLVKFNLQDFAGASQDFSQVLAKEPERTDVLYLRAISFIRGKDLERARQDLDALLRLDPFHLRARYRRQIL